VKEISLPPTLTPSLGLKNWFFSMNFFPQDHLYVHNIYKKFQSQIIYTKKDIWILPTCIAVRKISLLPTLTPYQGLNFFSFSMNLFSWDYLYVYNICDKFQVQKIHTTKDIWNLTTCDIVRDNFTIVNFDTLPKTEKSFFHYEIFFYKIISMLVTCVTNFKFKRFS